VTYNYVVTNNTGIAVPAVQVTDTVTDANGTTTVNICNQSLPATGSFTCSAVDQIGIETTNIAHASAPSCNTADSNQVTVTVNGGVNSQCPTAQSTLAAKDHDVKWKITAPKSNSVTISKIEITFPQGVDDVLQEVKRAGDSIFKGSLGSPATITTFSGDEKKLTIEKGHTDEVKFHFKGGHVAATGYVITITFTNGCTVRLCFRLLLIATPRTVPPPEGRPGAAPRERARSARGSGVHSAP
jgi:hypothetical protein